MIRVGMCPAPKNSDWEREANPHIIRLIEAASSAGIEIVPLSTRDMADPGRAVSENGLDLFHLHWASSAFDLNPLEHYPVPVAAHRLLRKAPGARRIYKGLLPCLRSGADRLARESIVRRYERAIDEWIERLEGCGKPIVWQQHDLLSHNSKVWRDFRSVIDAYLHERLFAACDRVILHEESCLEPVFSRYGGSKPYSIVPIGRLSDRPMAPRADARRRLGLPADATIFAYVGASRPNRTPNQSLESFAELNRKDCFLVIASKNSTKHMRKLPNAENIVVLDRFLSADEIRDVYCASSFVINDAEGYLTSGVVRSAISYGVPVIAREYGSTSDMARGAMIAIGPRGLTEAMRTAAQMSDDERASLASAALARDEERTWEAAGAALRKLYESLT